MLLYGSLVLLKSFEECPGCFYALFMWEHGLNKEQSELFLNQAKYLTCGIIDRSFVMFLGNRNVYEDSSFPSQDLTREVQLSNDFFFSPSLPCVFGISLNEAKSK